MTHLTTFLFLFCLVLSSGAVRAQCGPNVPQFTVNLSSNIDSLWTSPDTVRNDTCCGAVAPDKCVSFNLTLNSNASGIIFDICDGAIPPGALFYQVACGPVQQVGEALCLSGPGPHLITFCKPGNNQNKYCIKSVPKPSAGPDKSVSDGCIDTLNAIGYDDTTIVWRSVFPGPPGAYDSSLSCTQDCPTTIVTGGNNYPPFIDYEVCGRPTGGCLPTPTCDTVRVFFFRTLNVQITPQQPTICFGQLGTWIKANPSGGQTPYSYLWNTNETTDSIFVGVGTYIVELTDGTGCPPAYDTVIVTSFANPITADAGTDDTICNQSLPIILNASVIAASGGVWSGGNGVFTPSDSILNPTYSPTAAELTNGFVELYLETTGNGTCPADRDTVRITFEAFDGVATFSNTNVSCNGLSDGQSIISVNGSDAPYSFVWDAQSGNQTGAQATGLAAGTYSVFITDANGCRDTVTTIITEPPPLTVSLSGIQNVSCKGGADGSATANPVGGTPAYSYSWSNLETTRTATFLDSGRFFVTVTDANGCTAVDSVNITEPSQLNANSALGQDVSCFGGNDGSVTSNPSGGIPPYRYFWSTTDTTQSSSNLSAGSYTVTVTDANGCTAVSTIIVNQPTDVSLVFNQVSSVSCNGGSNGSAIARGLGGRPPYSYTWPSSNTDSVETNLRSGNYLVTVSDANGCTDTASVTITEPLTLLAGILSKTNVSCFGGNDGSAIARASGGTSPYTFTWPSNNIGVFENNLTAGTYILSVTDNNGCVDTTSFTITQPDSLDLAVILRDPNCFNDEDGRITATASGGTSPYTFNWSNGQSDSVNTGLRAGAYTLTLTDQNSCTTQRVFTLNQIDSLISTISPPDTICIGESANLSVSSVGGNGGYQYLWDNNLGAGANKTVSPQTTTTYTVGTTDSKGCPAANVNTTIYVRDLGSELLNVTTTGDICIGDNTSIQAIHNGTLGPYTYFWNFPAQGLGPHVVSPTTNTWYKIVASDGCGNPITDSVEVKVQNYPTALLPETLAIGCSPLRFQYQDILNQPDSNFNYSWDFGNGISGSGNPINYIYQNPGSYSVKMTVSTSLGCSVTNNNNAFVFVKPTPVADFNFNPPTADIRNPFTSMINASNGNPINYRWNIANLAQAFSRDTAYTFPDTGNYKVSLGVENIDGCVDTISKIFRVNPFFNSDVPNAFTPNTRNQNGGRYDLNNVNNEVFFIFSEYAQDIHLMIFNRWGEMVFESFDKNIGWDGIYRGQLAQSDVYVYKAKITYTDGSTEILVGDVTLLR